MSAIGLRLSNIINLMGSTLGLRLRKGKRFHLAMSSLIFFMYRQIDNFARSFGILMPRSLVDCVCHLKGYLLVISPGGLLLYERSWVFLVLILYPDS